MDLGLFFEAIVAGGVANTTMTPSLGPEDASVPVWIVKAGWVTNCADCLRAI